MVCRVIKPHARFVELSSSPHDLQRSFAPSSREPKACGSFDCAQDAAQDDGK